MSYALAAPLQQAVFQRLAASAALSEMVGTAIFDALPMGQVPDTYVTVGDEDVRDRSDKSGHGAWHEFSVRIVSDTSGFQTAKEVAGAVCDALLDGSPPALSRGRVVGIWFLRARARRIESGDARQIDLRFRAQLEDE